MAQGIVADVAPWAVAGTEVYVASPRGWHRTPNLTPATITKTTKTRITVTYKYRDQEQTRQYIVRDWGNGDPYEYGAGDRWTGGTYLIRKDDERVERWGVEAKREALIRDTKATLNQASSKLNHQTATAAMRALKEYLEGGAPE